MQSGIDPKVDYAFKRLLGSAESADLLISFLNAVLNPPPDRQIQSVDILNPFQPRETDLDKLSILDLKARDNQGRLFNIEMQLLNSSLLTNRIVYYWARMFAEPLTAGEDYDNLRPAISVCICDFNLFPQSTRHHLTFRLLETADGFPFSDNLELHTLELKKFQLADQVLANDLDRWLYFLRNGAELDAAKLPAMLDHQVFRRAIGVLNMIQENRYEHELYESRRKKQLDENSRRLEYERGLANALVEGRAEGELRGELKGQIKLLEQFLALPATAAASLEAMTIEELRQRATELQTTWASQPKTN
jgi:predicted transposase/invertase (TIGR01784 family)